MFISVARHEREKQELAAASSRLTDAILKTTAQGIFLLDSKDRIQPQVSNSLATLFRRQEFANLSFEKLIAPLVTAKMLATARAFIAKLREQAAPGVPTDNPLLDVEVRLPNEAGGSTSAHYSFEFEPVEQRETRAWLVRVTDISARVQQQRELEDLRVQVKLQGEILRSVLAGGGARFGSFLQRTDTAMQTINTVLKKPAREAEAFRGKLEETLTEVDRLRRDSAALKLSGLEGAARHFEDALMDLKSRGALSGSDFLPLAVKLDQLYGQFVMIRSLTLQAAPSASQPESPDVPVTEGGTQIIQAPKFAPDLGEHAEKSASDAPPAPTPRRQRMAAAGSLESTLTALTEMVAQEHRKTVVLEVLGMHLVPSRYQSTIKNVAIQMIRNAIMHGIETPSEREARGKPLHGTLHLEFKEMPDRSYEMTFQDDGCGLDPGKVRATAVERGIVTSGEAEKLRDKQAIKLIFKSAYSTLPEQRGGPKHGKGMSLVRRYVHESGGKIALASLHGFETRFKISLPPAPASEDAQVA